MKKKVHILLGVSFFLFITFFYEPTVFGGSISSLTPEQITELSADTIASLTKDDFSKLSRAQMEAFIRRQIPYLPVKNISPRIFNFITINQLVSLTPEQVSEITQEQFKGLDPSKRKSFITAQVQALNTRVIEISMLSVAQRGDLTAEQVKKIIKEEQFLYVPSSMIPHLTRLQCASIKNKYLKEFSVSKLKAFTPEQIVVFSDDQVIKFTDEQWVVFSPEQIQAFDLSRVKVSRFPQKVREYFVGKQIRSIKDTNEFRNVPASKISEFTIGQISSLKRYQLARFTLAQLSAFRPVFMATFTNEKFSELSKKQRAVFNKKQVRGLDTTDVRIVLLTSRQRKYLTPGQVENISRPAQFQYLPSSKISQLTTGQIASINEARFSYLSGKQILSFTEGQIQAIDTTKVGVDNFLVGSQLEMLTKDQIHDMTSISFSNIKGRLTPLQKAWRHIRGEKVRTVVGFFTDSATGNQFPRFKGLSEIESKVYIEERSLVPFDVEEIRDAEEMVDEREDSEEEIMSFLPSDESMSTGIAE